MATLKFWNAATGAWEYVPGAGNASYSGIVPSGSTTAIVNHGLGTTAVAPQCFRTSNGELVLPTFTVLDPNRIQLTFAVAPTAGEYRVLVISAIPNESPIGAPVIMEYFATSRGTGGLDAGPVEHADGELVIPNPGQYVEMLVNMSGRIALGPAVGGVEVFANLKVSFDGGSTWTNTPTASATPSGTGDEEGGSLAGTIVIKGTPTGDIIVRAESNRAAGATSGTVNIYVQGTVQIHTGENVVLDNRYLQDNTVDYLPATALFDEFPLGVSVFAYSSDATWFYANGIVTTHIDMDGSLRRGVQINADGASNWPRLAVRRFIHNSNEWGPWGEVMAGDLPVNHFSQSVLLTSYPMGHSFFAVENDSSWIESYGLVDTYRASNDYARQTFTSMNANPPRTFVRRWIASSSAWSSWSAAH